MHERGEVTTDGTMSLSRQEKTHSVSGESASSRSADRSTTVTERVQMPAGERVWLWKI